jgi:hypothetical protein
VGIGCHVNRTSVLLSQREQITIDHRWRPTTWPPLTLPAGNGSPSGADWPE